MKRLLLLICLSAGLLSAYDFGLDSRNSYTIFDPDERVALLTYPSSWLMPSKELLTHQYADSTNTMATWDQLFNIGYLSNIITAKYTPYSFPHRWSAGLAFTNYKSGNATQRTDAVLSYKHALGEIEYYHTNNLQTLLLKDKSAQHDITSHGLSFLYTPGSRFRLSGGMDINYISQLLTYSTSTSETKIYDIHHEYLELNYMASKRLNLYSKFHYRYFVNNAQTGSLTFFYPGMIYKGDHYVANVSLRMSANMVKPVIMLKYQFKPIFFEAYTKVRCPILILKEQGRQYIGFKTGMYINKENFSIEALYHSSQDLSNTGSLSFIENQLSQFEATYILKRPKAEFFLHAQTSSNNNPTPGYYHPERSILEAGTKFNINVAKGNLILHSEFNAQYITHDDPENVSFDPSTLTYTLLQEGDPVNDWKANLSIKAIIKSLSISLLVSSPIDIFGDLTYHLEDGIYASNDLYYGNNFYAGLNIEWYWWK